MNTIDFVSYMLQVFLGLLSIGFCIYLSNATAQIKKILFSIVITIFVTLTILLTILYIGIDVTSAFIISCLNHVKNCFIQMNQTYKFSFNFIRENVLNHWYNFTLPWLGNDMTGSFFDSTLLIVTWSIYTISIIASCLFLGIGFIQDTYSKLISSISKFVMVVIIGFVPIITFSLCNTSYLINGCSVLKTFISIVIAWVLPLFTIIKLWD